MIRQRHVKGQKEILGAFGLKFSLESLDEVNRSKDLFANHPRSIDGKRLSPRLHRGHEHGIFTNMKWARKCGFECGFSSVVHNLQDRLDSKQLTFTYERLRTWYPGKFIDQSIGIPALKNGIICYEYPLQLNRINDRKKR
jgi:hypothetical protein